MNKKSDRVSSKCIAFMATLPPPSSGEANVTKTFFESLPGLGYELHLIDVGNRNPKFFPGKLSIYNLNRMLQHLGRLVSANATFHPAFVNLMFSYAAITKFALFALISKWMGIRVIGQMHDPCISEEYKKCSDSKRKFIRWVFGLPDGWIVLGDVWKNFMMCASVPISKICVIPNAVKQEFSSLAVFRQSPVESEPPILIFTGTVGYRKGIDVLLKALIEIEAEEIAFKVQIVGGGEFPGERENLMEQYHINLHPDSFEFISHTEGQELVDFFKHASIFVLPSRAENLPVAMLEAMSCALPVVVSRVGAVEEVVKDGENGLLVQPDCHDNLKIALMNLLCNPILRRQLGQNAQQTILNNHMPSQAGNKLHHFLEQLMG